MTKKVTDRIFKKENLPLKLVLKNIKKKKKNKLIIII
jgi:hypothetical protein